MSELGNNFWMWREKKTKIKNEINLNYNVIGRDIRRKTLMLTQDSARIDPIARRIKGFSFSEFEDDCQHSRRDFSLFSQWNLTFKHSIDVEINLEDKESKKFKDWDV